MKFSTYTLCCFLLLVLLVIGFSIHASGAVTNWPSYQYLMVDQNGIIQPTGYTAGLSEIAQTEAAAAANEQSAALVTASTAAASNVVNDVVDALTGTFGFCYVTGHTVSFAGAVEVSTNATAQIVFCQFGAAGTVTTNGVQHTGHYIWHAYSETMNATPAVKYKENLSGTNAWTVCEFQSTAEFSNTNVNGVAYETVYRSTVWLPSTYDSAFFMAFCEILSGGSAGALLDVYDGLSVNGKTGYTGDITRDRHVFTYKTGLLMSVTNEAPQ